MEREEDRPLPDGTELRPSLPSIKRAYKRYLLLKQYPLRKQCLLLCLKLTGDYQRS